MPPFVSFKVCAAGSWATLPQLLEKEGLLGGYDIILSAETIYSMDSQRQLLACIKQVWVSDALQVLGVGQNINTVAGCMHG